MLCTLAKGGMKSVVEQYQRDGLFDRWSVIFIGTHDVAPLQKKIALSISAEFRLIYSLIFDNVSVVHIHAAMRGSFWRKGFYSITALAFRKPVIFHLHGSETRQFMGGLNPLFGFFAKTLLGLQTRVVVLSEEWRRFINSVNPAAKIEVLPNYVNLPKNLARPKSGEVVTGLFLGQIGVRKGIYDLLPALKEVASTGVNVRLRLGGDGEVGAPAGQHVGHAVLEHPAVAGAVGDDLVERLWIDSHAQAERHRLCRGRDVHTRQQLVDDLHLASVAGAVAQSVDVRRHRIEHTPGLGIGLRPASRHHGHRASRRGGR